MSEPIQISGIYYNPQGDPLADITITGVITTDSTIQRSSVSVTTQADSYYAVQLQPGEYVVTTSAPRGEREKLGLITLEAGSPAGTLNDYLRYGETQLADRNVYSDIKKMYRKIAGLAEKTATDSEAVQ